MNFSQPVPVLQQSNNSSSPSASLNLNLSQSVPVSISSQNATILQVIPPKKTIFAARFASCATTDDIQNFIINKIGFNIDITVFKFKYSEPRNKLSFKIIVPQDHFATIVNQEFWLPNALIREYEYKYNTDDTRIVFLLQSSSSRN